MIKFKRYPYRVGENYGMNGGLTKRQITLAINKPVRQAKKLQQKPSKQILALKNNAQAAKNFIRLIVSFGTDTAGTNMEMYAMKNGAKPVGKNAIARWRHEQPHSQTHSPKQPPTLS